MTRTLILSAALLAAASLPAQQVHIDASAPIPPPETGFLHMGGTSPTGHTLQVNSRYLVLDGKPWLPVMGEIHYARVPEAEWEDEILKMKAAGINIISTYIFWIHHEEVEGQFDFSGRRDLRHFVELCAKHGMYVYIRPGPWAHGEVRNGGFPDWLVKEPNTRTNDPAYLAHVAALFNEIGKQIHGLTWKEGGPIIGTQLENEYGKGGPTGGAAHIAKLKELALAAGIDTPLFSVTGWPTLNFDPHEVLPVSGGYPDGFWFGSTRNLPPSMNYLFNVNRQLGDMGAITPPKDSPGRANLQHAPYFAAEYAGGMASSYLRRPVLTADDIAALTLTGIGAGVNLYGYYMFHGGANPTGKLSTLQESRATAYPNDMTEISYDFEAPLGEYGQVRDSYRKTRMLHLFLNSFGEDLAPMAATGPAPEARPKDPADTDIPRVAVRTNGSAGFVFMSNYIRQTPTPIRKQFQVEVKLASETLRIPDQPVDVPSGAYFIWPFNLPLGSARLIYSTAEVVTRITPSTGPVTNPVIAFAAISGIPSEFIFTSVKSVTAPQGSGATITVQDDRTIVSHLTPGATATIEITDRAGAKTTLLLLTHAQAENLSVLQLPSTSNPHPFTPEPFGTQPAGQSILAWSSSTVFADGPALHLRSTASPNQQVSFLPAPQLPAGTAALTHAGLWTTYAFTRPTLNLPFKAALIKIATARATMDMLPSVDKRRNTSTLKPTIPTPETLAGAGVWHITAPAAHPAGTSNLFIRIAYTGDMGQLRSGTTLLDDNFFNGQPWTIGLNRFAPELARGPLDLDLLSMPAAAPIYLDEQARTLLAAHPTNAQLTSITLLPEYEILLTPKP